MMCDLISRGALLKDFAERQKLDRSDGDYAGCFVNDAQELSTEWWCVEDAVESAPAVDAAPVVHARWIHDINNLYGCSACLERETMSHKKMKRFCPNCGAKMDGGAAG